MPRILVSAPFDVSLLARQTPSSGGIWGDFEFVFEPSLKPVDGWVVIDDLVDETQQLCPQGNTLLISGEPESVRRYRSRFTSQFDQFWTSQSNVRHPQVFRRNEAQHWHYAMRAGSVHGSSLNFDELVRLERPTKPKLISVISSNKVVTPDHRKRLEFVEYLKQELGDVVDVFGRGIRSMDDKSEAIWPYKYHIVLENDHSDYFMTEKISDAFLGWSYPIYFGGHEAYYRFPEGSFTAIDVYQPETAMAIVRDVLRAETFENTRENVASAREAVLYQNNLFAMLVEHFATNLKAGPAEQLTLLPRAKRASLVLRQVARSVRKPFTRRVA